ncbi:hypothetical protein LWI29_014566 [Acer saccharum]|uniref:Uncharacterized protein n=1 Tax=Acer saccharum TaxID=4024 RepID=A0AA39VKD8_ACESA|nr:hypothetical protein LWI29_014566 [Acer saccharum]
MANDDYGGLLAGGGNRSLEELRISHTILEQKVDFNLRIRENRAPPVRHAHVSSMGARGQKRARLHVQPASPEFSGSDEGGIPNRRRFDEDSHTDNDVEELSGVGRVGFNQIDYGWGPPVHVVPIQVSSIRPAGIVGSVPLPKKGIRLITWSVEEAHLQPFIYRMKKSI